MPPEKAVDLRCEYVVNPLGIDNPNPRFSFIPIHTERGQSLTAYQIMVATDPKLLLEQKPDMWDSGKVNSTDPFNITYNGKPLESCKRYYWRVRWWDSKGNVSPWSDIAYFETGFLNKSDWHAKWIYGKQLFRKEFEITEDIISARAYIAALGYYELRINGKKVSDRVLDPGWTDYKKRVLYSVYDISDYLRKGKNVVGVILSEGRYLKQYGYDGVSKFIIQLRIKLSSGKEIEVISDENWLTSQGPIMSSSIYDGEIYDARLEKDGWDTPEYTLKQGEWEPAKVAPEPQGLILASSASFPPIRVVKSLQPVEVFNPKPSVYVFDFGQNFTGWVKIKVRGPKGTTVTLRYAEEVFEDKTIDRRNLRNAKVTDVYILKGNGLETFEPRFTYHGFRYVEVTGYPGVPTIESIEAKVVHTDVENTGGFSCSEQLINRLHKVILWTQVSNLMSIPTDCPQRDERMGWTGDAQLSAEEAIHNYWMVTFYEKWMNDIKDSQLEDGQIPDVVPPYWKTYPADPAWGTAYVYIPWLLYLYYGDVKVLKDHYDNIRRWIEYLISKTKDYILEFSKYGDWVPPMYIRPIDTSPELVSTAILYDDLLTLARMSEVLGKYEDYKRYMEIAEKVKEAFNKRFLKEIKNGNETLYVYGSSQTSNILPLAFGLVPNDKVQYVFKALVNDIEINHDKHLATGIIGTRYLFEVLSDYGRPDLAYDVITQTTYPGYGYMLREGATTLWERWEYLAGPGMNSHNHIMFGSVDTWFYKYLAGIRVIEPGFKKIKIEPIFISKLNHVSASLYTIRGLLISEWFRDFTKIKLHIITPVGSMAELRLPKVKALRESDKELWREGKAIAITEGILGIREEGNSLIVELGSGEYQLELEF